MQLKNPDAPASSRQLYALKRLTGRDYSDDLLTMQEASDKIEELGKPGGIIKEELSTETTPFEIPDGQVPFSEPHVALITGEQRSGKSITAVGRVVDAYDRDCLRIYCEKELGIQVIPKGYDRDSRIGKFKHNGKTGYVRVPKSYKMYSPLRIYCNFHLFGVPYVHCSSFRFIIDGLKSGLILAGYLVMDEYYIGGYNRDSLGFVGKTLAQQQNQYGKMMLDVIIIAPIANQLDWTSRLVPTEQITTEYNKKTGEVTCRIKKKGKPGVKIVTYDSKKYRRNYWTNERINK